MRFLIPIFSTLFLAIAWGCDGSKPQVEKAPDVKPKPPSESSFLATATIPIRHAWDVVVGSLLPAEEILAAAVNESIGEASDEDEAFFEYYNRLADGELYREFLEAEMKGEEHLLAAIVSSDESRDALPDSEQRIGALRQRIEKAQSQEETAKQQLAVWTKSHPGPDESADSQSRSKIALTQYVETGGELPGSWEIPISNEHWFRYGVPHSLQILTLSTVRRILLNAQLKAEEERRFEKTPVSRNQQHRVADETKFESRLRRQVAAHQLLETLVLNNLYMHSRARMSEIEYTPSVGELRKFVHMILEDLPLRRWELAREQAVHNSLSACLRQLDAVASADEGKLPIKQADVTTEPSGLSIEEMELRQQASIGNGQKEHLNGPLLAQLPATEVAEQVLANRTVAEYIEKQRIEDPSQWVAQRLYIVPSKDGATAQIQFLAEDRQVAIAAVTAAANMLATWRAKEVASAGTRETELVRQGLARQHQKIDELRDDVIERQRRAVSVDPLVKFDALRTPATDIE